MSKQQWLNTLQTQHQQAFNVARAMPENRLAEIRLEVEASLHKGAAFDTLKTTLQRLTKQTLAAQQVPA